MEESIDPKVLNAAAVAHDLINGMYRKSNPTDSDSENECRKERVNDRTEENKND